MTEDARFADGAEAPLRLMAADGEDLQIIATLVRDAVLTGADLRFEPGARRFSILLNRFRWEDRDRAETFGRPVERVRSVLSFDDVIRVQRQGIDPRDGDAVLSLLLVTFEPDEDGQGAIILTFAGDGAIRMVVESVNVLLADVTRPYAAPSGQVPRHDLD